jgi:Na+/proline symporter
MDPMPLADRPFFAIVAALYLVAVTAVGIWAAPRTRTASDFFIAGQRLGLLVTGLATMSAAFSGFVFLGGPGLTYRWGLSSLWIVLPVGLTGGLLCWVLGKRLRLLAGVREIYTVPDAVACRFGCGWPSGLAAVAVVVGTVAYLGAQILALGVLLQGVFGIGSLAAAMALGLVVLLGYSVLGGMIAGVYTDVLQGALMLLCAVAVFTCALAAAGGWHELTASIAGSEAFGPRFLAPFGEAGAAAAFGLFFVFGVGVLGQPHMLHKFFMLRDPQKLAWMPLVLGSSQVLCLLVWVGIGLAVPALVAQGALAPLERPDDAAPVFLMNRLPDALTGLALAGVLSAIMSTADSLVNIGAAAIVRDLPRALGRPTGDELRRGRWAVAGVSLAAGVLAWSWGDLIALLGTLAFGTFAAALAPALAVGLTSTRITPAAASASIATGLVLNVGLELLARSPAVPGGPLLASGIPPAAVALAASFTVLYAVSWWAPGRGTLLDADVRGALDV